MNRRNFHAINTAPRQSLRGATNAPSSSIKPLATAVTLAMVAFSQPSLAANCIWNPVTGNWGTAGDWTCGLVPGGADSATVAATKTVTINSAQSILNLTNAGSVNIDAFLLTLNGGGGTTNTGTINVGAGPNPNNAALNIGTGHNVTNTGGTINVSADSVINQFGSTISGGTINTTGTGKLAVFSSSANFLDSVTLGGRMDMASVANSRQRVTNGLTLNNATVDINQNGILSFENTQTLSGTGSIVFGNTGAGNRIDLDGNGTTTIASGVTIRGHSGTIGQQINIGGTQTLVNNGLISADVSGGTIGFVDSAVVNNGTLRAINGGTLVLSTNVTGGASGQIVAGAGSQVLQNGVTISGTVNTSGGGLFSVVSSFANRLDGVTFNGNMDMASIANSRQRVTPGGLVLNGTVNINSNGILSFEDNGTFSGNGTVVFGNTGAGNRIDLDGNGTTTIASGVTIRGHSGTIGQQINIGGTQTLVNNGLISADVSGGTIGFVDSAVVNNGTLRAINGGTLVLSTNVTGGASGQIVAGAGSQVLQNGVTISGTVNTSGGGLFSVVSSFANRLDGVTFNGNMDMASIANSRQRVTPGGLVLNGTVNINSNGILSFEDNGTFSGNGTVVFGNTGAGNRIDLDGNGTTTIASGVTIRGHSGTIGQHVNIGGTQTLVNNGLISADVSGGTIGFVDSAVVNNSTLKATNGGLLNLGTAVSQGASGVILADNGTVRQNGARISGGTIASANGGALQVASSSANYLDAATISGVVDMASVATSRQRVNNGLTNNGTININQNAILSFEDTQTLSGTGSIVFGNTGGGNRIDLDGNGTTTIASGVTIRGHSGAIGQQINIGGTQTLLNQGTINAELAGGTIGFADSALVNNGVLRAQAGTMYVGVPLSGTGTLQVDSTGTMNLANGAKGQGTLAMGGAGAALNLGTGNLTLSNDYTNAGAGTGNAFNRRAGVSGTGQIVAGGDVSQVITGANVTNGNTANATLTVGNVRVGSNTFNYQIGNAGTTGPTLRGAIQTAANGGNINDARLSGTGVTASNYNAGGPGGNSGNLAVVFNAASAGALAPLSGQAVNLRSNFENIADQKLNIVLAGGAAAYNAAVGAATPTPVVIANQRVGGTGSQMLTVSNTAAAGAYSEDLNASVTGFTGAAGFTGGNINGLLAGANNSSTMGVRVDTTLAGAKTGTVTLGYQTAGAVNGASNGLGVASAGSQTVTVSGNVYQVAAGALQGNTLNFGTLQVGQQVSQNLVVRNTATGPAGFVEDLNASFGASGNSQITGTGSLNGILAGTNSTGANGTMTVTVLGSTAGALNSGIAVNYFSAGAVNGVGNGLGVLGVGSEQFNVNGTISAVGNVINQASPLVNTPTVTLAARRVGDAAATANVSVSNVATVAPQAALNASIATNGAPVTASGSFNLLTPGATDNSSLVVGIGTATAGNFTGGNAGSATISLVSDASNVGGCAPNCQLNLAPQTVTVEGKVYTAAQGAVQGTVNFGIVHVGDVVAAQGVAVQNSAPATALNDTLKASIGGTGGAFTDNGGTVTGLVAGGAANTSALAVGLDTTTAGIYSGNAIVSLASQNPDMADLDLGTANVSLSGQVNKYANAVFDKVSGAGTLSRSGNVFTLDFGNVLLGGALSAILDVDNAVGGGPSDLLDGVLGMNDVNDFTTLLLSSFQNIGADGSGGNALSFLFDTNSLGLGTFQDSIDLGWFGHNASGYVDPTRHYTLLVRGNVYTNGGTVPEPSAALLVLTALAGLALRRRRSGRAC